MPARRFRECMEVQVTIRSPIPARPPKVCRSPPAAPPDGTAHHGPCHQQGFALGTLIPHTVADAAGQRHHVFQGADSSNSHDIGAGIHPEAVVHKGVLHREGSRLRHAGLPRSRWGSPRSTSSAWEGPMWRRWKGSPGLLLHIWLIRVGSRSMPWPPSPAAYQGSSRAAAWAVSRTAQDGTATTTSSASPSGRPYPPSGAAPAQRDSSSRSSLWPAPYTPSPH